MELRAQLKPGRPTLVRGFLLVVVAVIATVFALNGPSSDGSPRVAYAVAGTAEIQIKDGDESYGTSVTGSLSANFTANTQTNLAGFIDVKNSETDDPNWDTGYSLSNAADSTASSEDAALNTALKVTVEAGIVGVACNASPGGGGQSSIVSNAAWAGTLFSDRTDLNTALDEERLCFYLTLTSAPNGVAGGDIAYSLTFTAE